MVAFAAYSTLAVTLGLVVTRPRLGPGLRVTPAMAGSAGVAAMMALGVVHVADVVEVSRTLWRPVIAIVCIMIIAASAHRVGALDVIAEMTVARLRGPAVRVFGVVFALSALTAAVLNNDAAIVLLTPILVSTARARFPGRPRVVLAFAFAGFAAAGVAPLVVSNPMNMVVASYAHIDFNAYAARMVPVAVAGWIVAFVALRLVFRRVLRDAGNASSPRSEAPRASRAQRALLGLLPLVVLAYSVAAWLGIPLWPIAALGAATALLIAHTGGQSPTRILRAEVSWDIVVFLLAASLLAVGLRNVGIVASLAGVYARGGAWAIAGVSALGSALLNNHPMAILNVLALGEVPATSKTDVLAALVGGDIGPRLFPIGSLAGLLWLESLRRSKVDVSVARFVAVGAAVTLPSLLVSMLVLMAMR